MSRSAGVGSPSSSRLWSEWPARITRVEGLGAVGGGDDLDGGAERAVGVDGAHDLGDRRVDAHRLREAGGEGLHVLLRAALDRAPLGDARQLEQAVVVHEPAVGGGGELEEGLRVGRPDRGAEGHEEVVAEALRVAALLDEVGEGHRVVAALGDQAPGPPVEAQDVDQHAGERRLQQVASAGRRGC